MPPTIGKKIQYKIIIVRDSTSECEKLMNDGWTLTSALPHAKGVLLVMQK